LAKYQRLQAVISEVESFLAAIVAAEDTGERIEVWAQFPGQSSCWFSLILDFGRVLVGLQEYPKEMRPHDRQILEGREAAFRIALRILLKLALNAGTTGFLLKEPDMSAQEKHQHVATFKMAVRKVSDVFEKLQKQPKEAMERGMSFLTCLADSLQLLADHVSMFESNASPSRNDFAKISAKHAKLSKAWGEACVPDWSGRGRQWLKQPMPSFFCNCANAPRDKSDGFPQ